MSMILCNKKCRHQCDGYCELDEISCVTDMIAPCGYFFPAGEQAESDIVPEVNKGFIG